MFHNTTNETGETLKRNQQSALRQEDYVLSFFKAHPDQSFTPFEVQERVFGDSVPVTSIRRAITCLTDQGRLRKTTTKRKGAFGKNCYCWRLA